MTVAGKEESSVWANIGCDEPAYNGAALEKMLASTVYQKHVIILSLSMFLVTTTCSMRVHSEAGLMHEGAPSTSF